jgi:hypothetical protein
LTTATKPLSEYAVEFDQGIVVLTADRKPVAAVVSLAGIDRESLLLSTSAEFMEIINQARQEFQSGRRISLEEMKQAISE